MMLNIRIALFSFYRDDAQKAIIENVIEEVDEIGRFENEIFSYDRRLGKRILTTLRHIIKTICKGIPTDTLAV